MRQYSKIQRRLAVGAFLITAGPVALGSAAYACQSIVTLQVPDSAAAGSTVTITGANYQAAVFGPDVAAPNVPGGPTGNSPIEFRLNERDGRIIGTGTTGSTRKFSAQVTIPSDVAAGVHTIIAMQYRADGTLVSGGPGRDSVNVTAGGGSRTAAEGTVAAPAAAPASGTAAAAPAAAAPVASAPAAAAAAQTSAARDAGTTAAPAAAAAAAPTAAAPAESMGTAPSAAATSAAPGVASSDAASPAPASGAASSLGSLVPASSESSNVLPGVTMAVGLALVLLSLGAFVKSGRNMLGRGFTPLAG